MPAPAVLLGVGVGAVLLALGGYALYLARRIEALEERSQGMPVQRGTPPSPEGHEGPPDDEGRA